MCDYFKKMKVAFIARFNRKPLIQRVKGILCWSLGLLFSGLLLSGHFAQASLFATLVSLAYLAMILMCKMVEKTYTQDLFDNSTDTANRTVDILFARIMEMAKTDRAKREQELKDKDRSAIIATRQMVDQMQEVLDNVYMHLREQNNMLKDYILPELGISISETEDDWVQCDTLGREMPYGLIYLRISNRLHNEGIKTFADLVQYSEREILQIPDFGPSSLDRIKQLLSLMGLHLKMKIKEEEGIWYYRREDVVNSVPLSAEEELLLERNDNEDHL